MPIYEYECQKCGYIAEKLVKHSDPNPACIQAIKTDIEGLLEKCEGETKKLISQSTFHLKGSGWYKDGY
tara:strand:- start:1982 stop:2188 length:207 start_codon:yes stop_codon:yes gene_type:complete